MSRLFIANCTMQIHTFTYRIPDSSETLTRPRAIESRAGGQAKLPDDLKRLVADGLNCSRHAASCLATLGSGGGSPAGISTLI